MTRKISSFLLSSLTLLFLSTQTFASGPHKTITFNVENKTHYGEPIVLMPNGNNCLQNAPGHAVIIPPGQSAKLSMQSGLCFTVGGVVKTSWERYSIIRKGSPKLGSLSIDAIFNPTCKEERITTSRAPTNNCEQKNLHSSVRTDPIQIDEIRITDVQITEQNF